MQNHYAIRRAKSWHNSINIRTSLKRQGRLWQQEEDPRAQPPRKWWRQRWKSPELQTSAPSCPNVPCSIILNGNILKVSIVSTPSISRKKDPENKSKQRKKRIPCWKLMYIRMTKINIVRIATDAPTCTQIDRTARLWHQIISEDQCCTLSPASQIDFPRHLSLFLHM